MVEREVSKEKRKKIVRASCSRTFESIYLSVGGHYLSTVRDTNVGKNGAPYINTCHSHRFDKFLDKAGVGAVLGQIEEFSP